MPQPDPAERIAIVGIGGIFRTLRTADHMLALGNELAELAPNGWLLNYTNPMAMLCQLVYQGTPTKNVVGLCHSVQFTVEDLSGSTEVTVWPDLYDPTREIWQTGNILLMLLRVRERNDPLVVTGSCRTGSL